MDVYPGLAIILYKAAVLCQKAPPSQYHNTLPSGTVAVDIRVVTLAVKGILIAILRVSKCHIPKSIIPVRLP